MKTHHLFKSCATLLALATALLAGGTARASVAYGSINNFDTVNDTGVPCHGFEIELDDTVSTDVTYTYDWNHYGTPVIREDTTSRPGHTNVVIRYAATYDAVSDTWSAYTAVPTTTIAPTDGHMFTDPSVNFGGEHFGVGYFNNPTTIRYNWLQDDGSGHLVLGPPVQVATPSFVYYPPVAAAPGIPAVPPRVQAAIVPPAPPVVPVGPVKEFGNPVWVKEIRTTSHGTNEVRLRDLVSEDPDHVEKKNWRNGEPDEVEAEWQIMQTEFAKPGGGKNGELQAAPEDLNHEDEIVTRRYEFYKYVGPVDAETGEVMTESVGPDGIHGKNSYSNTVVVGDYIGAQMSAVDVAARLGLIDHLNNGEEGVPYVARTVVISGSFLFTVTNSGALPTGMTFDEFTGVLSGTPTEPGVFTYTVGADDGVDAVVKTYTFTIAPAGMELPPQHLIEVAASPAATGTVAGGGLYDQGGSITVTATPAEGYALLNWTENGLVVSVDENYTFTSTVNRTLTANFFPGHVVHGVASPGRGGAVTGGGGFALNVDTNITLTAAANAGYSFVNWTENGVEVSTNASVVVNTATNHTLVAHFLGAAVVNATVDVPGGGTVLGAGNFAPGESVTLTAVENPGYQFWGWTVDGTVVSYDYTFTLLADTVTNVVANFFPLATLTTSASPVEGGTTSGDGVYWVGDVAYIQAVANPGYTFINWTSNGVEVSVLDADLFALNGDTALVANFAAPPTNHPPVAVVDNVVRPLNLSLKIKIADLLTNDSDPDGDALSLLSVSATTDLGVPLAHDARYVFYPASTTNAADEFQYTISDGRGGTATATVNVAPPGGGENDADSQHAAGVEMHDGHAHAHFLGVPGFSYVTQRSVDTVHWVDIRTNTAPVGGVFTNDDDFSDTGGVAPPTAFYRLIVR